MVRLTIPVGTTPGEITEGIPASSPLEAVAERSPVRAVLEAVTATVTLAFEPSVMAGALMLVVVDTGPLMRMTGLTIRTAFLLLPWKLAVGREVAVKL